MNRFRTKKKAKDDGGAPRPSQDSESSMHFRPFQKKKKAPEPEKVDIDLSSALPSNDDFRTSLLMNGLSARFSMLREQDDPSTKIGKASDDSVLHPRRQSKMDYGAFRGLSDIAEVESIKTGATFARVGSYVSSEDADSVMNGSGIMGRAKPTEGNNLFGGRQKIYKIPVGANSSKTVNGGMGGRALYEDDVAMSAFQKWRLAEKGRASSDDERVADEERNSGDIQTDMSRSVSPFPADYNRKRETSSTTSSVPSMARNSTAATSVTSSQHAPSMKDWQSSASSTPALERNVTRTRRLYETGLNQDFNEKQSTVLARVDTLARQRHFGSRTPDLSPNTPSPTAVGFAERFGGERRIMAKGSAPNLRSMSPPATASSAGTPDLGIRVPSVTETRTNFSGTPPLSPPVSETDENSILPIQPNDRGKATALGVFQKPSQPYDESKYAQRQLQLQQGRETPTQRFRDEPRSSSAASRSRSPSSTGKQTSQLKLNTDDAANQAPATEEAPSATFLADADDDEDDFPTASSKRGVSPQVLLRRPSDQEHPALRSVVMPTPPVGALKPGSDPSLVNEVPASRNTKNVSPSDSPTLGPAPGAGLNGMVRQHLRGNSNASSIYSAVPPNSGRYSRFPDDSDDPRGLPDFGTLSNPWDLDLDVNEPVLEARSPMSTSEFRTATSSANITQERDGDGEFANQLADGARRVRERLTTYVESDSRSASPHSRGDQIDATDLPPSRRSNALSSLWPEESRGPSVTRGRDPNQPKAMKILGMNSSNDSPTVSPVRERRKADNPWDQTSPKKDELENRPDGSQETHAGLRAFRQARRELQRVKELETQARHQPQDPVPDIPSARSTPSKDQPLRQRSPSRDRKPPPVFYQPRGLSEESRQGNQASRSQASRNDRDRSGSDSSNNGRSGSQPPRLGDRHLGSNGLAQRPPLRSPGLPGTDIKRSPIMPPQPYPGAKMNQTNFASNNNLRVQPPRSREASQASPVSPLTSSPGLPVSPRPGGSPNHAYDNGAANVPATNDSVRRKLKTRDISEPTFVRSTSRVPTVALPPEAAQNRSRSNSRSAPPVPPINPRRRTDSKTRTVFESLGRRKGSLEDEASASTPNLSAGNSARGSERTEDPRSAFSASDDEDEAKLGRRRLRKVAPEIANIHSKIRGNNPPANVGLPPSRIGSKRPGAGLPGDLELAVATLKIFNASVNNVAGDNRDVVVQNFIHPVAHSG
ncbi:hypothetical protein F4779DRAFT_618694 [Xylariaceae sp. FL0662B]|nr:hypothetical protein F4779DRAFT_618694 [Xylariaceae sp. FL0662B]